MRCDLDAGAGGGARLGLIVLSTDESLEHEMGQIAQGRVNLLHSRIPSIPEVTPETLRVMAGHMTGWPIFCRRGWRRWAMAAPRDR